MSTLVACWVGAYFVLIAAVMLGVARVPRSRRASDDECPTLSIVVSARNEAGDLPAALRALDALDYPADRWELILVNDRSTDETPAFMTAFAVSRPHVRVLHTADAPPTTLEAKARGVALGASVATGEWILITDADAVVPRQWARHLLGRVEPTTGVVGGAVIVRATGFLGIVERVSWAFTQTFAFGAAGWGMPFIALGPNMGVRRSAYEAAGGLAAARPRVAEDLAMFLMVVTQGLRVQLYQDADTTVEMEPVASAAHLISQQRRWLGGGMSEGWLYLLGLWVVFGWGAGVALYFVFGWMGSLAIWGALTAARLLFDGAALMQQQRRLGVSWHLRYLPVSQVYVALIFLFLAPSMLVRRRLTWRGSGYTVHY